MGKPWVQLVWPSESQRAVNNCTNNLLIEMGVRRYFIKHLYYHSIVLMLIVQQQNGSRHETELNHIGDRSYKYEYVIDCLRMNLNKQVGLRNYRELLVRSENSAYTQTGNEWMVEQQGHPAHLYNQRLPDRNRLSLQIFGEICIYDSCGNDGEAANHSHTCAYCCSYEVHKAHQLLNNYFFQNMFFNVRMRSAEHLRPVLQYVVTVFPTN